MANLAPSWQLCRIVGTWLTGDLTKLRAGTYTVTYPRATNTKQRAIIPAGKYAEGNLNTNPGTPVPSGDTDPIIGKSLDIQVPATDDPDIRESVKVTITVNFGDGAASETYVIDAPSNGLINLDDLLPLVGGTSTATLASLKVGLPGGVAGPLDAAGKLPTSQMPTAGVGSIVSVNGQTGPTVVIGVNDIAGLAGNDPSQAVAGAYTCSSDGRILNPDGTEWLGQGTHITTVSFGDNGDALTHAPEAVAMGMNIVFFDIGLVTDPGLPSWYPTLALASNTTYNGLGTGYVTEAMPTWKRHILERIDAYLNAGLVVVPCSRDSYQTQRIAGVDQPGTKGYLANHPDIRNGFVDLVTRYRNQPRLWINPHVEPPFTGQKWLTMHNLVIDAVRAAGYVGPIICDPPIGGQDLGTEYSYAGGDFAAGYRWLELVNGLPSQNGAPALAGLNNRLNIVNGIHWYGWSTQTRSVAAGLPYIAAMKAAGYPVIAGEMGVQTVGSAIDLPGSQNYLAAKAAFDLANGGKLSAAVVWHGHLIDNYRLRVGTGNGVGRFWDTATALTWVGQELVDVAAGRQS